MFDININSALITVKKILIQFPFLKQPNPSGGEIVVARVRELLKGFGLREALFLRLVPSEWSWSVATLSDDQKLAEALTSECLSWVAKYFGVRLEWLEGEEARTHELSQRPMPSIFNFPIGYKQLDSFVQELLLNDWHGHNLKMTVLAADYDSGTHNGLGSFGIIFSYPEKELEEGGDVPFFRHIAIHGVMDWKHYPCRMDAKAMVRWFCRFAHRGGYVPIVPVKMETLRLVVSGGCFANSFIPENPTGYDQLDNRVLSKDEFADAIEFDELPDVLARMEYYGLTELWPQKRVIT